MYRFRVFLSYSRKDQEVVERISAALQRIGLAPVWDRAIQPGTQFTDAVKEQIATAHLFMPVLSRHTQSSPWVHQEIGFAIGIDVPVLPIALGRLPGQMLAGIQALQVDANPTDLENQLRAIDFKALILPRRVESELERLAISVEVADEPEERARTLVKYAQSVHELGRVRQRVIFSSFSLPNAEPRDASWNAVDSPRRRSESYRRLLRNEREILEAHARQSGCSLILHPFSVSPSDASAQRARLRLLIEFLSPMPEHMVKVAVTREELQHSLILVGDWFGAKASPPRAKTDYRNTFFCRHAPTVLRWVRDFDRRLDEILVRSGVSVEKSRDVALAQLEDRLHSLPTAE